MRAPNYEFGLRWLQGQTENPHIETYLSLAGGAPLKALDMAETDYVSQIRHIFTQLNKMWSGKQSAIITAKNWAEYPFDQVIDILQKLLFDVLKLMTLKSEPSDDSSQINTLFFPVQREWIEKIIGRVDKVSVIHLIDQVSVGKKLSNTPIDKALNLEDMAINFDKLI